MPEFGREFSNEFGGDMLGAPDDRDVAGFPLELEMVDGLPKVRKISWSTTGWSDDVVYKIYVDEVEIGQTTDDEFTLQEWVDPRQYIEVWVSSVTNAGEDLELNASTPLDKLQWNWDESTNADVYRLYRKISGGAYPSNPTKTVLDLDSPEYVGVPLVDETYVGKVTAVDWGTEATTDSDEETVIVSSAPEPPSGLSLTAVSTSFILQEDNYLLLQEDGNRLLQE